MKILLAVDGSDYTQRMLSYLGTHADTLGTHNTYAVLHVVLPVPPHAASFVSPSMLRGYYEDEAGRVLDPIRVLLAEKGIQAEYIHHVGNAAEEISAFAQAGKFDLIVMGSRGHGALSNLVLGSVATKVLARCDVPVLLVR